MVKVTQCQVQKPRLVLEIFILKLVWCNEYSINFSSSSSRKLVVGSRTAYTLDVSPWKLVDIPKTPESPRNCLGKWKSFEKGLAAVILERMWVETTSWDPCLWIFNSGPTPRLASVSDVSGDAFLVFTAILTLKLFWTFIPGPKCISENSYVFVAIKDICINDLNPLLLHALPSIFWMGFDLIKCHMWNVDSTFIVEASLARSIAPKHH